MIVDFDDDTSTPLRVFLIWLDVVKGFLFTRQIFEPLKMEECVKL